MAIRATVSYGKRNYRILPFAIIGIAWKVRKVQEESGRIRKSSISQSEKPHTFSCRNETVKERLMMRSGEKLYLCRSPDRWWAHLCYCWWNCQQPGKRTACRAKETRALLDPSNTSASLTLWYLTTKTFSGYECCLCKFSFGQFLYTTI